MTSRCGLVRNFVLSTALLTAVGVSSATYPAPLAGWAGDPALSDMRIDTAPPNVPAWTAADAAAFPRCVSSSSPHPRLGWFIVVRQDATRQRMGYDRAVRVTHDVSHANDVWVIGTCA